MKRIKEQKNKLKAQHMQEAEVDQLVSSSVIRLPDYLRQVAVPTWFRKNQVVAFKSERACYAYLVLQGEIIVQADYESGNYYAYARIGPGRYISDLEVLSGRMVFANTMTATKDTFALRFNIEDFIYCLEEDIPFLRSIAQGLALAMYETSYARGQNHYRSSTNKLISLLLRYSHHLPRDTDGDTMIPYTRGQMASELGINIKTVNRGVATLKELGMVDICRGKIRLSQEQLHRLVARLKETHA